MANTSRERPPRKERLWVPGAAYLDNERILRLGREVGYNGSGPDFRLARCHHSQLADLNHRVWLVERAQLNDELIDELAIIMPHTLVDAQAQPHARRWLDGQPLVCVSGIKRQALIDKDMRLFCVEHGVEAPTILRVQAAGGDAPDWSLRLDLDTFTQHIVQCLGGQPSVAAESLDARSALDRILRQLSRGILSEQAIINAFTARQLVEPGYGYRGNTDGRAASVEHIAHGAIGINALFAQVYARAAEQRLFARNMREALRGLTDSDEQVQVPIYGVARQRRLQALELTLDDDPQVAPSWLVEGEPKASLTVHESYVYAVDEAELWSPKLTDEQRQQLQQQRHISSAPPRWVTPVLIVLLLLFIALASWQLS